MSARAGRARHDIDVYALAERPLPRRIEAGGRELQVYFVGPIGVIAARAEPFEGSIEDAIRRQHAIVIELADRVDPLLPARFGSRLSAADLEAAVRPALGRLERALEQVRGCRQMTVRILGPEGLSSSEPRPATGTAYLAQRRAAASPPTRLEPLSAAVRRFVLGVRVRPGTGKVRATLYHLVRREDIRLYRRALADALPAIAPWTAAVTGPWPPFAFAPELVA